MAMTSQSAKGATELRELEHHLTNIIDLLPDATFAVDIEGKVIAWNRAIEDMTGIPKGEMVGKSEYAYAVPFLGEPRPILIDLVIRDMKEIEQKYYFFRRKGDQLIGEAFAPMLNRGKGAYLWGIASPLYDRSGSIVGAIQSIRDITERKKVEEALKNSEREKTAVLSGLKNGSVEYLDPQMRIIWVNEAVQESLGISVKEMQGKYCYELIEGLKAPCPGCTAAIACKTGEPQEGELVTPDGKTWISCSNPLKDSMGQVIGVVHVAINITERKRAEEKLRETNEYLESLFNYANAPIVVWDPSFGITTFNHAFERLTGLKADEVHGEPLATLFPESSREESMAYVRRTLSGERWEVVEIPILSTDGCVRTVLWNSANIQDKGGKIIATIAQGTDITERKRAEIIRERSLVRQEQLNLLQQTLLSPGGLEQKLKLITDSIVEIFGADFCRIWITSPGDLCEVGCVHVAVTEGPHVCRYRDRCLRLIASSGRYTHTDGEVHRRVPFGCYKIGRVASGEEHKLLTNDVQNDPRIHNREWAKEIGLVTFAGYQLRPPGEDTLGVLALFSKQNITVDEDAQLDSLSNTITRVIQTSRVDEELRQHQDLLEDRVRERTAEMERFIYTVSHDLRSPLVTMSGFVGLLKEDLEKGDSQRAFSDLLTMNEAITKMDRLLMDALELSRIGRVINPIEDAAFDQIVREALEQTAERIKSRNVSVSVARDLPDVRVDMPRIVEVLVNLIENSLKYMGDQERPKIEIGSRKDGEETVFFVRDNGIGIDPKEPDKVFDLFYKVDKKSEGSGAGLAIVKKIIEVHGGRIWIESELGKGCTVCFTLPLAQAI